MRGGHQLIIDSANCVMYLFGGWDGFEDLSDLWCYNIKRNSWTLIHERAEVYGGPSPRSCHKMVYDPCNSHIFTLGRYLDSTTRTQDYIKVSTKHAAMQTIAPKKWLLINFLFYRSIENRAIFICMIRKQKRGRSFVMIPAKKMGPAWYLTIKCASTLPNGIFMCLADAFLHRETLKLYQMIRSPIPASIRTTYRQIRGHRF